MKMRLADLLEDVENKGVRRVRTPAGVRFYGKPIGTIITRDMRTQAKASRRARKDPQAPSTSNRPASPRRRAASAPQAPSLRQMAVDAEPKRKKRPKIEVEQVVKTSPNGTQSIGFRFKSSDGKVGPTHWTQPGVNTHSRSKARNDGDDYLAQWDKDNAPADTPPKPDPVAPPVDPVGDRQRTRTTAKQLKVGDTVEVGYQGGGGKPYPASSRTRGATSARKITDISRDGSATTITLDDGSKMNLLSQNAITRLDDPEPVDSGKKVEPSTAVREHIEQLRSAYDHGNFQAWDQMQGTKRYIEDYADKLADDYDKQAEELQRLLDMEDSRLNNDEEVPAWITNDINTLTDRLEKRRVLIEKINALADENRDVTMDDLEGDGSAIAQSIFGRQMSEPTDDQKRVVLAMLNNIDSTGEKDRYGRLKPSQPVLDARDDMVELGTSMLAEMRQQTGDDPAWQQATQRLNDAYVDQPPSLRDGDYFIRLREWEQRMSDRGMSNTEVDQYRVQVREQLRQAQRDVAIAERNVKLRYLNSIRPMGPHPDANFKFQDDWVRSKMTSGFNMERLPGPEAGSAELYDQTINDSLAIYPTSWIATFPDGYYKRAWSGRAFHSGPPVGTDPNTLSLRNPGDHTIALRTPAAQEGVENRYDGAFESYKTEVAAHEVGHGMEIWVPGVAALEWAELYNRSGRNRPGGTWEGPKGIGGSSTETAFPDDWKHTYAGRNYDSFAQRGDHSNHHELFTTGVQDVFGRASGSHKQFSKPGDDNAEALILGMMATLNYYDDEEDWRKK